MIYLSCDPGKTGAIGAIEKETGKCIEYVYNYDKALYKTFLEKYKGCKLLLERIPTVMSGAFASYILGQNIGEIRGLAYGLCEIIENKNTPREWKSVWKDELLNKDKTKTNKEKDIIVCSKYYPEFNYKVAELDENRQEKIIKKGSNKGKIKLIEHDGLVDMYLISQSAIIRELI